MKFFNKLLHPNSFIILSILCFLIFNFNYLFTNTLLKGDDASSLYYPGIFYLKENLNKGIFPFYTEKIFSGYPIYQYSELGYLNPLRILLTYLLPFEKVLPAEYFVFFVIGIIGYFKFLRIKNIADSAIFFSHFIFFYNFQFTGRFVHQQLIFTVMLLPMLLYLTDRFFRSEFQNKKKIYLIQASLLISFAILYGSFPGIFLLLLAQCLFIFTECLRLEKFKLYFKYYFFYFLTFISISFYSLYPTFSLYSDSARNIEKFSITKGSISPVLLSASFFTPLPLGTYENYLGENFSNSWFWHEIHTYQGLSFLIICIFGFIYFKNIDFKKYFIVCFSFFVILATLKYTFFGNILDFFPFNLFRYHLRFGSIFCFSLAILGASVIHKFFYEFEKNEHSKIFQNIFLMFIPLIVLIYSIFSSLNFYETKILITHFKNAILSNSIPYLKTSFISTTLILILLILFKFIKKKSLLVMLPIISVFELLFFTNILYTNNLVVKSLINPQVENITKFYEGKRVVFDNKIYGNQTLYYKNWNIYGYSAYDQKDYKDFLENAGLNIRRYKEDNYFLLEKLGVYRVIDENYNIHGVTNGDIFSEEYEPLDLNENSKKFKFNLSEDRLVTSFIKKDKNIEIFINSQKVENPKTTGIFYNVELSKGESIVEFIYRPKELYLGLILGLILTITTLATIKNFKF